MNRLLHGILLTPVTAVLFACASAGPEAPAAARPGPPASQIMDACMKVEVPAALKLLGVGAIRTRDDAGYWAHNICQAVVQSCSADPNGDACQQPLRSYGLGVADRAPSAGASLYDAAQAGATAVVGRLLAAGADPNIVPKDQSGWTALIGAAAHGHVGTVERLLRGGADPAIKAKDGSTALEMARAQGHAGVVRVLQAAIDKRN